MKKTGRIRKRRGRRDIGGRKEKKFFRKRRRIG